MSNRLALARGDGFTYRGTYSKEFNVIALRSPIHAMPGSTHHMKAISGRDGSYYFGSDLDVGIIPIDCALLVHGEKNIRLYLEEILDWLDPRKGEGALVLDTAAHKEYRAICKDSFNVDQVATTGKFSLTFMCPDPIGYAVQPTEITAIMNAGNSRIVGVNGGTEEVGAVLTFTFSAASTSFKVTEESTGRFVELRREFNSGDVVTIDLGKGRVEINGVVSMTAVTYESDWFLLPAGSFSLKTNTGSFGTASLKFRMGWF